MKKTPLKRGDTPLKRGTSPLKGRILKKRSIASQLKEAQNHQENYEQKIFFERIWNPLRPDQRVCYETGVVLHADEDGFPFTTYFHHVLPKELYPQFRYSPWNIVLVSLATHSQLHDGPELCPKIHKLYLYYLSKASTLDP